MRNPLADEVVKLKPSGIRKFFDIVAEMKDAISLGVGEPDFETPWHIRDEGIRSLEMGKTFYTSNSGLMELRKEICNYVNRHYNITYDPAKEVLITVGGSEGIDACLRAMLNPGDEVCKRLRQASHLHQRGRRRMDGRHRPHRHARHPERPSGTHRQGDY